MKLSVHTAVELCNRGLLAEALSTIILAQLQAMRLETEFQRCLQRQSLEWAWQHSTTAPAHIDDAAATLTDLKQAIAPSMWVKLVQSPSAYSSDEALLLCQCGDRQWLVWVPDYGETILEREQFDPFS